MDTEADLQFRPRTGKAASAPLLPEVEAYLQLLVVIFLMTSKRYKEVSGPGRMIHVPKQSEGLAGETVFSGETEIIPGLTAPQTLPPLECTKSHSQGRPLNSCLSTKGKGWQWSLCGTISV